MKLIPMIAASVALVLSGLVVAFPARAATPANQTFNLIEHAQYHFCVNTTGPANGDAVELYQCETANSEEWTLQSAPYGHGTIEIKNKNGYCLADTGDSTLPGEPTEMYNCSAITTVMQKADAWTTFTMTIGGIGYAAFRNANGAVCLNDFLNQNFNGNDIVVAHCDTVLANAWI